MTAFNGLGMGMHNLSRLSTAKTRSISAENFNGEKGRGGMATEGTGSFQAKELGQGWKVSPSINLPAKSPPAPNHGGAGPGVVTLADIAGPGAIQHIWLTVHPDHWRGIVLRMHWDDEATPSVEVPLGDFFCNGWCKRSLVNSLPVSVNPANGFNSYWEMPFRRRAVITVENLTDAEIAGFYYQVDYALTDVPDDCAYFHAQFRRSNPLPYKQVHVLVDGIVGVGQYVGTYLAWQANNNGWWGEGEIKFYLDGDDKFPTICGTGTEDYFGGAWNFEMDGQYVEYSTPFLGLPQVIRPNGTYQANQRFGMYRWHIMDPIRFEADLRVTIQALAWRDNGPYLPLQDDIASTVFWYQAEPHGPFPTLPDRDGLAVI